jgi:septal ring-binding cell division protein DamX
VAASAGSLRDSAWLLNQDPNAYTLQLIAVSQARTLRGFVAQLPPGNEVAMYQAEKASGYIYIVVYGVFPDAAAARAAAALLPARLGQPIVRQLKTVQPEIRKLAAKLQPATPTPIPVP